MKKTITTSFIIISLIALASCGSSGTTDSTSAPTITSLTDANSQTIESTGSTGIWPSSFTATFSDTIDATSFTTDNITMTCDLPDGSTVDQPTILIGEDTCVMEACTFSIEDAWKYALLDCTLTFTTGISTSVSRGKSTAFEENEIFTFTNACAVNDDFNADSESCWPTIYIPSDTGLVETDWATLNAIGYFTFNTTGSSFDFAPSGAAMAGISKEVVTGTDGFSATIHLKNPSGFTTDSGSAPEQISVQLADNPDLSEASITLAAGIAAIDPDGDDV